MWNPIQVVSALVVASLAYFLVRLYQMRKRMEGLPSTPRPNWLVGNIDVPTECSAHFPPDVHAHVFIRYIQKKHNLGRFFYQDWWPLGPQWLFITDPEIASQYVTSAQSLPKSSMFTDYLNKFLGDNNMLSVEGDHWKSLRTAFNPGFSANHLMTLVPYIVDASLDFGKVLRQKAETGELVELEDKATNLTIEIIGKVVLDADLGAQEGVHPIVKTFRDRVLLMPPPGNPVNPFHGLDLLRPLKLWWNGRRLDRLIGAELDRKINARANDYQTNGTLGSEKPSKTSRQRSVVDLAIDNYQKELKQEGKKVTATTMSPRVRKDIIDSMKAFIFAGKGPCLMLSGLVDPSFSPPREYELRCFERASFACICSYTPADDASLDRPRYDRIHHFVHNVPAAFASRQTRPGGRRTRQRFRQRSITNRRDDQSRSLYH